MDNEDQSGQRHGCHPQEADERHETERALINRIRGGQKECFASLMEPHIAKAYRTCLGILRSPHLAEEAVQNSMIEAYTSIVLQPKRGDYRL